MTLENYIQRPNEKTAYVARFSFGILNRGSVITYFGSEVVSLRIRGSESSRKCCYP